MSWRRFNALLGGLSAESRFIGALSSQERGGRADVVLSDDAAVDRFVASLGG